MATPSPRWKVRVRLALILFAMALAYAAFGATFVAHSDRRWIREFLPRLVGALMWCVVFGAIVSFTTRSRGDLMPPSVWRGRPPTPSKEPEAYRVGRGYGWSTPISLVGVGIVAAVALGFWGTGLGVLVFLIGWSVFAALSVRRWWRDTPVCLTLRTDQLDVRMAGGRERHIPIGAITDIRWTSAPAGSVMIFHEEGRLDVPAQIPNLTELVVELRRRNESVRYDGDWPPVHAR